LKVSDIRIRVEQLTLDMVRITSVSETAGEDLCARFMYDHMAQWPYYQEHPEHLRLVPIPKDPMGRHNLIALMRGGQVSPRTVVLLGHLDTVATDDYGDLQSCACDPCELEEKLKTQDLPEEVRADLESGEWMFGRGAFDMKSGLAAQMAVMADLGQRLEDFSGNLVFLAVPDEENNSAGMLAAVHVLNDLAVDEGLEYMAAIDSDYTAPRYPGDENNYVYVGTVGKLLPSFLIVGKETHVGQSFEGVDPNQLASELTRSINMSMDLCDGAEGEFPSPPVTLRQKDTKEQYSVQTAGMVELFFNYHTHRSTPDQVLEKLLDKARSAFDKVIDRLNREYKAFCSANNIPHHKLPWQTRVVTVAELHKDLAERLGEEYETHMDAFRAKWLKDTTLDGRDYGMKIVREMIRLRPSKDPVIVVFFLPPYYPHIYVEGEAEQEKHLLWSLTQAITEVETETGITLIPKKFYPYISDLSYFSTASDPEAIQALTENMPGWGEKYELPLEAIAKLNLPVVNIGPMGKDAHKYTERLQKDYSFRLVPLLLEKTLTHLLVNKEEEL
jgi:arginine utilization protein RocB